MPKIMFDGTAYGLGGGKGNANVVEMTQAEYDALPNPDPETIYFITDANAPADVGDTDISGIGDGTITGAIGELASNRPYYKITNGTTTEFQFELTSNKQYLLIAGYHGYGLHHRDDTTGVYLVGYLKGYYAPVVGLHSSSILSGVTIDMNTGILTVAFNKSGENYRATLVPLC